MSRGLLAGRYCRTACDDVGLKGLLRQTIEQPHLLKTTGSQSCPTICHGLPAASGNLKCCAFTKKRSSTASCHFVAFSQQVIAAPWVITLDRKLLAPTSAKSFKLLSQLLFRCHALMSCDIVKISSAGSICFSIAANLKSWASWWLRTAQTCND